MSTKEVYLISEINDPYEPAHTAAICESEQQAIDLAKESGLDHLWHVVQELDGSYNCLDLITNETKLVSKYGFPLYPQITTMNVGCFYPMNPPEDDLDEEEN